MSQRRTYRLIPCRAVLGYQSRLRRARLMITLLNEGQWALFSMVLVGWLSRWRLKTRLPIIL